LELDGGSDREPENIWNYKVEVTGNRRIFGTKGWMGQGTGEYLGLDGGSDREPENIWN